MLLGLVIFLSSYSFLHAHQSISFPTPISKDVACRISKNAYCPGPCPTLLRRMDRTPNNPSITVKRGEYVSIHTLKNNHQGGFSRWALVHVKDMYNKDIHRENAFLFTCADVSITKCTKKNEKRDCNFDKEKNYFRHNIRIPHIYSDGVYVLGWVWYGGGGRWGHFGDYYDCMFIRVKGGPMKDSHTPQFRPGPSMSRHGDRCVSTVNQIGICYSEPCVGGGAYTSYQKPWEFSDGRMPVPIPKSRFMNPHLIKPRTRESVVVTSITVRSADHPDRILATSRQGKFFYLLLTKAMRTTVTCEVDGRPEYVVFYTNGIQGRNDTTYPYSIAGDWMEHSTSAMRYAPWSFDAGREYVTLSCKAVGPDGIESWLNTELATPF